AAGVAGERRVPKLARTTFRSWFAQRPRAVGSASPDVAVWTDTFTNHFQPWIGRAAVEVLEAGGRRVALSPDGLCCGRPLYDHGMLSQAQREGRRSVDALRPLAERGVPVVGLEPSCVAVFR